MIFCIPSMTLESNFSDSTLSPRVAAAAQNTAVVAKKIRGIPVEYFPLTEQNTLRPLWRIPCGFGTECLAVPAHNAGEAEYHVIAAQKRRVETDCTEDLDALTQNSVR